MRVEEIYAFLYPQEKEWELSFSLWQGKGCETVAHFDKQPNDPEGFGGSAYLILREGHSFVFEKVLQYLNGHHIEGMSIQERMKQETEREMTETVRVIWIGCGPYTNTVLEERFAQLQNGKWVEITKPASFRPIWEAKVSEKPSVKKQKEIILPPKEEKKELQPSKHEEDPVASLGMPQHELIRLEELESLVKSNSDIAGQEVLF